MRHRLIGKHTSTNPQGCIGFSSTLCGDSRTKDTQYPTIEPWTAFDDDQKARKKTSACLGKILFFTQQALMSLYNHVHIFFSSRFASCLFKQGATGLAVSKMGKEPNKCLFSLGGEEIFILIMLLSFVLCGVGIRIGFGRAGMLRGGFVL